MDIRESVPLAPFTTLGIGGPARWFVEAASEDEILGAIKFARDQKANLFVLGGGSNLLVSDAGFDGLVLRVALRGIDVTAGRGASATLREAEFAIYHVAAGEDWDSFVSKTVQADCAGVECLAGIPGTVGGTPVQNVGAYGQEVSQTIDRVRVLDLRTMDFIEMSNQQCGFAYRTSVFNSSSRGRVVVTRVDYRLNPAGAPNLRYADIQREFGSNVNPTLSEVAEAVRRIRQSKGMLLMEGDVDCHSAGSFFKNPIVTEAAFLELRGCFGAELPHFPGGEGFVKLPAAWLIETAGFRKGYAMGRAAISSKHTLALINLGGATAAEVLALRDQIVAGVRQKFGISLEMEPVTLGMRD